MLFYLLLTSLLIPANLWAAITPHLHSELSMRVLHGVSTAVLLPLLISLWRQRLQLQRLPASVLAVFVIVMVVVNLQITAMGMGVVYGWLDHVFLAIAAACVVLYYLIAPDESASTETTRLNA